MEQKITSAPAKGITISLVLIVISLVTYFANLDVSGPIRWLGLGIFIVAVILSIMSYGKQIDYNSTFGNYFSHGFRVSAIVTVIMIVFTVIFILMFPELKDRGIEEARKQMREKNNLTPEQMDQALDWTKRFFMTIAIAGALISYMLVGVIAALVGAGITKKNPAPFNNATIN